MTKKEFELKNDCAEAHRLEAALRDPGGWPKPPPGFYERCLEAVLKASASTNAKPKWHLGRPAKIAASIAALLAFAGFAAWVAAEMALDGAKPAVEEQPVDAETEMITKESEVNMIARKTAGIVGAALTTLSVGATELMSEPTFVFLKPETSSFWHTATNKTMTVPVDFPTGATTANLYITGDNYTKRYEGITSGEYTFELPAAVSPETENVYTLQLVFDDTNNTVRTAKLGLIQGVTNGTDGLTRCLAPASGTVWNRVKGRAVLPIPYGTTSFTVNGETRETGLNGDQGWYALRLKGRENVSLQLIANEIQYDADLTGDLGGFILIFK